MKRRMPEAPGGREEVHNRSHTHLHTDTHMNMYICTYIYAWVLYVLCVYMYMYIDIYTHTSFSSISRSSIDMRRNISCRGGEGEEGRKAGRMASPHVVKYQQVRGEAKDGRETKEERGRGRGRGRRE